MKRIVDTNEFSPNEYAIRFGRLVQVKYWDLRENMWYFQFVQGGGMGYSYSLAKVNDSIKANYPEIFAPALTTEGIEGQSEIKYAPCDENDVDVCGYFTSMDGRSMCYVKEIKK